MTGTETWAEGTDTSNLILSRRRSRLILPERHTTRDVNLRERSIYHSNHPEVITLTKHDRRDPSTKTGEG